MLDVVSVMLCGNNCSFAYCKWYAYVSCVSTLLILFTPSINSVCMKSFSLFMAVMMSSLVVIVLISVMSLSIMFRFCCVCSLVGLIL